ncbi:MAG: hypothetical protein WDZ90_02865 [Candidatus Paceibacterota bacterium]
MNLEQKIGVACLPIDLCVKDGKYFVVLAKVLKDNLRDPFFLDSLAVKFKVADVSKTETKEQGVLVRPLHYDLNDVRIELISIDAFLLNFENENIVEKSTNFIFHMSRCGSTLATQMLATVDRFYVISEPTIILAILNPLMVLPDNITRKQLLKAAINAICAWRPDYCERIFIKFRSWNILYIEEILILYPNIQWMFTHRNGLEVLESVLRDPPGWMRSRHTMASFFAPILGLSEQEVKLLSEGEYATRLLGIFCKMAKTQQSSRSLFVDYLHIANDLPSILNKVWNMALTEREMGEMLERTKIYSKDPQKIKAFESDSEKKRVLISGENRRYAEKFVEVERKKLV